MRIALVSMHANPLATPGAPENGGTAVHVDEISRHLGRLGHEVTVYTRRDDRRRPDRSDGSRYTLRRLTAGEARPLPLEAVLPHIREFTEQLRERLDAEQPDVIFSHGWVSGLAALQAVNERQADRDVPRPALIHAFHSLASMEGGVSAGGGTPEQRRWIEPWIARNVDRVIATSTDESFRLRLLRTPKQRIAVLPGGVDTRRFTPKGDQKLGPSPRTGGDGAVRVATVGRLTADCGVDSAIRAMAALGQRGGRPPVELFVYGGRAAGAPDPADPDYRRLSRLATDLGIEDRVRFMGAVPHEDLPAHLRSMDLLVSTPWTPRLSLAPLEAMACGVPVVTTAAGGNLDTVLDGTTGLHVPQRDTEALAQAIRALATSDGALLRRLGDAGRTRMLTHFTWRRVALTTARLFEEVVAERSQAGGGSHRRSPLQSGPDSRPHADRQLVG